MCKKYLNAEQILAADDFRYAEVDVPEWDGTVRIKSMTANQRDILSRAIKDKGESEAAELMLVMCVVDENGKRIFERNHIEALKRKSVAPISRIVTAIGNLSGGKDSDIESAEKNLDLTTTEDSPID